MEICIFQTFSDLVTTTTFNLVMAVMLAYYCCLPHQTCLTAQSQEYLKKYVRLVLVPETFRSNTMTSKLLYSHDAWLPADDLLPCHMLCPTALWESLAYLLTI